MRVIKALIVLALVFVTTAAMAADDKKPLPTANWSTTLPAMLLSNRPLEDVLKELKTKLPGFDFTISRIDVPHDQPVLPEMTVESISLLDFLELVARELPEVSITYAGYDRDISRIQFDGSRITGPLTCRLMITSAEPVLPQTVKVFGLGDIISYRATFIKEDSQADREKQASNDILSLVQAGLELTGTKSTPVLKMHPQTQTLLFKGTDAQAEIITNTLAALQPTPDRRTLRALVGQDQFDRLEAENKQLKDELQKLKATTKPAR